MGEGGKRDDEQGAVSLGRWIVERKKGSSSVSGETQVRGVHGEEIYVAPD